MAALWHAAALYRAGEPYPSMQARVRQFWELSLMRAGDTLTDQDFESVIRQATKRGERFRNLRTAVYLKSLRVTPDELALMDAAVAGAGLEGRGASLPTNARQQAILSILETAPSVPSVRAMQQQLGMGGISASPATIWADYKRLGIEAKARPGRPAQRALDEDWD